MKKTHLAAIRFTCLVFAFILVSGCGLKYIPGETPESVQEQRRLALQDQLYRDYQFVGKTYRPVTYGVPSVVKPVTFVKLDSLFEVKYRRRGSETPELDQQIARQQAIIRNDTNQVLYVETHFFVLSQDSTDEYVTAEVSLTRDHKMKRFKTIESFETTKANAAYAEKFVREGGMFNDLGYITPDETKFYDAYKKKASTLKGKEKDLFMAHTFEIMKAAAEARSYSTEVLLRNLSRKQLLKDNPSADANALKFTVNEVVDNSSGKSVFMYYEVTVTTVPESADAPIGYRYDAYLQPVQ